MTRRIGALAGGAALRSFMPVAFVALAGCSLLTDAPLTTARVEVDPTPIRSIRYLTVSGWSEPEVTTKRLDEIECHRATPACSVRESITATIHNTGDDRLEWHNGCDFPLEEFGLGAWHATPIPCSAVAVPPLVIPAGERHTFSLGMSSRHTAEYRVRVNLRDAAGTPLPERMRTSETFHYQALPDVVPCPAVSEVERAGQLAREVLERAARGDRPPNYQFLLLENRIPGFGGYYSEASSIVVWVKEEAHFAAAEAVMLAEFGRPAVARKGNVAFSELIGWQQVLGSRLSLPGLYSYGPNAASNRVRVGMSSPLYVSDASCIARGIGMPAGSLEVEVNGEVTVFH